MRRVFISGIGIVSALGIGKGENRHKLIRGLSGIGKAKHFQSRHKAEKLFGEVGISDEQMAGRLGFSFPLKGLSRTDLLALTAFFQSVEDARLTVKDLQSRKTSFISAGTVGGMCHTDALYRDATSTDHPPSPYIETYAAGYHAEEIVKRTGIKGFTATINTACSSSANAIMLGARLIKAGKADRVIAGGVDSLAKYTVNGFNSLGILSKGLCKPFDADHDGLNLGEGAAYLVLESEDQTGNSNALAEVVGYGNANDAFHLSAISADAVGPVKAMKKALETAKLHPEDIDFINAHGTGTENNDATELKAFTTVFKKVPPFVSTKCYTGHTLGAAGAVEAVFSVWNLMHREIYPALNVKAPLEPFGILPVTTYMRKDDMHFVMSNSFGFAGNCTSLIFSKP